MPALDDIRLFTPDEAKAALPKLRPLLAALREAFHEYRFAHQQAQELFTVHGESIDSRGHPDFGEYRDWRAKEQTLFERVQGIVREINAVGADVKDPILGLVDFYHKRANGQVVLLCYRDDEAELAYWHPLDTGFAGRRPLREL